MIHDLKVQKLGVKWGLLASVGMIIYFLIMYAFNLNIRTELRLFNLLIQGAAITLAFRQYRKESADFSYFKGITLGGFTALVNVVTFSLFMTVFLMGIDPQFMAYLKANSPMGANLNPLMASGVIFLEGLISGYFISFTLMQYFKTTHSHTPSHQYQKEKETYSHA